MGNTYFLWIRTLDPSCYGSIAYQVKSPAFFLLSHWRMFKRKRSVALHMHMHARLIYEINVLVWLVKWIVDGCLACICRGSGCVLLDLSQWSTILVKLASFIWKNCTSLTSMVVSGWVPTVWKQWYETIIWLIYGEVGASWFTLRAKTAISPAAAIPSPPKMVRTKE